VGALQVDVQSGSQGKYTCNGFDKYMGCGLRYRCVKASVGMHFLSGKMDGNGISSSFANSTFSAGLCLFFPISPGK